MPPRTLTIVIRVIKIKLYSMTCNKSGDIDTVECGIDTYRAFVPDRYAKPKSGGGTCGSREEVGLGAQCAGGSVDNILVASATFIL